MEIERAVTRHERGLKPVPVICFVKREKLDRLSWMVRGIKAWNFHLISYSTFDDIEKGIDEFARPVSERVVTFLMKDDKILLGKRKEEFGKGIYVGIGGSVEKETREEAAIRELEEETGIKAGKDGLEMVAEMSFIFPEKPGWTMHVTYYILRKWEGEPAETDEIIPEWFSVDALPYDRMWDDAKYWMGFMLEGKRMRGSFIYEGKKVRKFSLEFL